ncbi:Putative agmatine deiminase [Frankliniella fusca]|uniref:Agmatine deiminase n=1 Tax=Frankliniella fusca TaxID=407009 RepID=A0AAE1H5X4_9NEOP|nr:Putative agmatine deiminase [Frankliniella fusca]
MNEFIFSGLILKSPNCGAIWMSFGVNAVISMNANMAGNVIGIDMSNFEGGVGGLYFPWIISPCMFLALLFIA